MSCKMYRMLWFYKESKHCQILIQVLKILSFYSSSSTFYAITFDWSLVNISKKFSINILYIFLIYSHSISQPLFLIREFLFGAIKISVTSGQFNIEIEKCELLYRLLWFQWMFWQFRLDYKTNIQLKLLSLGIAILCFLPLQIIDNGLVNLSGLIMHRSGNQHCTCVFMSFSWSPFLDQLCRFVDNKYRRMYGTYLHVACFWSSIGGGGCI